MRCFQSPMAVDTGIVCNQPMYPCFMHLLTYSFTYYLTYCFTCLLTPLSLHRLLTVYLLVADRYLLVTGCYLLLLTVTYALLPFSLLSRPVFFQCLAPMLDRFLAPFLCFPKTISACPKVQSSNSIPYGPATLVTSLF